MIARQLHIQCLLHSWKPIFRYSVFILLLMSCSESLVKPTSKEQQLWEKNQQQLHSLNKWQANGRVAVYNDQENWLIKVRWHQTLDNYQLYFSSPSGQSVAKLVGMPQHVEMFTAENQHYVAHHPDDLVEQTFNIHLPVTGLGFWIRGIPSPDIPVSNYYLNEKGYLTQLEQAGWTINFQTYAQTANWFLPQKLLLSNPHYRVKIIISDWYIS